MSKQVQEAYIVAATRTPIGRSHRGYFRNTRPDDLLATALRLRWPRCRRWTRQPLKT
jgi:acetyl-CoA acyltransferase